MMEWNMIHQIKILQSQGLTKRAIAQQLKIHRKTVDKYTQMSEEDICKYKRDADRVKKLDEYRALMIYFLQKYPKISAPRMADKLAEKIDGFECPGRSMRRYLGNLKRTVCTKQKRYYEPVIDMVAGIQCQIDAGELRKVLINGSETTVYFLVFVLSFSRAMYVAASLKPINTNIFIRMHDVAFRYFGGIPEECVYDQTKLVVIDEIAREITVNQRFNEYATVVGFDIHSCRGYDPESKGKVEAGVKYVKNNCFYAQEFDTEQAMYEYIENWLTKANNRIHGTTGKVPKEVLANQELKHLKAYLVPDGWKSSKPLLTRKADKTSLISWNGNKYSIPDSYQDSNVGIEPSGNYLYVYDLETNSEIAQIQLSDLKGETFKNPSHYRRNLISDKQFEDEMHELIGDVAIEICKLLKQSSPKIYRAQLRGFIAFIKQYENITSSELSLLTGLDRLTVKTAQVFIDASREKANDKPSIKPQKLSQYAAINLSNSGVNNG